MSKPIFTTWLEFIDHHLDVLDGKVEPTFWDHADEYFRVDETPYVMLARLQDSPQGINELGCDRAVRLLTHCVKLDTTHPSYLKSFFETIKSCGCPIQKEILDTPPYTQKERDWIFS